MILYEKMKKKMAVEEITNDVETVILHFVIWFYFPEKYFRAYWFRQWRPVFAVSHMDQLWDVNYYCTMHVLTPKITCNALVKFQFESMLIPVYCCAISTTRRSLLEFYTGDARLIQLYISRWVAPKRFE